MVIGMAPTPILQPPPDSTRKPFDEIGQNTRRKRRPQKRAEKNGGFFPNSTSKNERRLPKDTLSNLNITDIHEFLDDEQKNEGVLTEDSTWMSCPDDNELRDQLHGIYDHSEKLVVEAAQHIEMLSKSEAARATSRWLEQRSKDEREVYNKRSNTKENFAP